MARRRQISRQIGSAGSAAAGINVLNTSVSVVGTTETNREFIFEVPNSPEEFGVFLPSPDLRRLDFSALDYQSMLRASTEYIQTYHPTQFNDFMSSNGYIMLLEILCYLANVLSERSDILCDESFLSTAQTSEAVVNHLALINQSINQATPANVDIQITFSSPVPVEVQIPTPVVFTFPGPDGSPVNYEVYRAPGDFTSPISIPANKAGVIAWGIEGITASPLIVVSPGGPNQFIDLTAANVLGAPITVTITSGNTTTQWLQVPIIQKSGPNDEVYEVDYISNTDTRIVFGDDTAGKSPLAGDTITVTYRIGGGVRGRIATGTINESRPVTPLPPLSATIPASFTNPVPSQGGTDLETLDSAKSRAPKDFATHNCIVTGEDYGTLAASYSHPVYGTVAKAVGTIRTGIQPYVADIAQQVRAASDLDTAVQIMMDKFINRNIVEVYVLAEGPGDVPVVPSVGLKEGLAQYLSELNVLTDEVQVKDGGIRFVDVQATIIINRSADAGTVKTAVQNAINSFFDIANFDFGTPLYVSNLYMTLQNIPGVKYVNIFQPSNDILNVDKSGASDQGIYVGYNEVIALGNVDLKFYFEQGNFRVPPTGASYTLGGSSTPPCNGM